VQVEFVMIFTRGNETRTGAIGHALLTAQNQPEKSQLVG
jgi:cytochrome P450